jgi:Na+-transporting NADH:ubiquinone oxidoreductase subunit A
MIKTSRGLDIPITGDPLQTIYSGNNIQTVGIVGADFIGMKPTLMVQPGDKVSKGQPLFEDKKTPGVFFTAPVSGVVREINRGERRAFLSLVIEISGHNKINFKHFKNRSADTLAEEEVRELLLESGAWIYLRTRPFSRTPSPQTKPASLFITATDTNPLAPDPEAVLRERMDDFKAGVLALSRLAPKTFVITGEKSNIDFMGSSRIITERFSGPHPSGNVGTHIHYLDPVSPTKTVWHVNYQDTIAIGYLFRNGEILNEKIISLAGPMASHPRLIRTLRGASLSDLVQNEMKQSGPIRAVSGSVLGGRTALGPVGFLGQFHSQVTLLKEGHHREFLGWNSPGLNKYSLKNVFLSTFAPGKKFDFDTNTYGSLRSIVPIGSFEAVMPLRILPTQLLRYLMVRKTEMAVNLGALELDEEDVALCTFVDPCKNEYGPVLRHNLELIEKEGV